MTKSSPMRLPAGEPNSLPLAREEDLRPGQIALRCRDLLGDVPTRQVPSSASASLPRNEPSRTGGSSVLPHRLSQSTRTPDTGQDGPHPSAVKAPIRSRWTPDLTPVDTPRFTAARSSGPGDSRVILSPTETIDASLSRLSLGKETRSYPTGQKGSIPYRLVGSNGLRIQSVTDRDATPESRGYTLLSGECRPALVREGPARAAAVSFSQPQGGHGARADHARSTPPIDRHAREETQQTVVDSRREHAIRERSEKVAWYASRGEWLTEVPIPPSIAQLADLFVNVVEKDRRVQVFLRVDPPAWEIVEEKHPHPTIDGYVLHVLDDFSPRWVTRATYRTYLGRWRKTGKLVLEKSNITSDATRTEVVRTAPKFTE